MNHIKNLKEIIADLKSQVPIQDLISEHITLKKSGRGYVGLCPFHDDKHPSMHIHTEKGIFKCFSCGAGGDLITFYTQITKKDWTESIKDLAEKYGVKIEYGHENKTEDLIKNSLYEINTIALDFFKNNLFSKEGKEALEYLKKTRNLADESISRFEIGFALNTWDSLYEHLKKLNSFSNELLVSSGLFIQKENEKGLYDRFRNRIIFPIYNESSKIIGFGGRTLSADKETAKYINSPETLIFNKGQSLYGINFAKDEIKEKDYSILTEGYLDVISAHQYGLKNTVATLGTALSIYQIKHLLRYSSVKKICLCLDSDKAGKKAVESVFYLTQESDKPLNADIRVISNLPKKDLDESLQSTSLNEITALIDNSKKIIYFIFEKISERYFQAIKENDDGLKNISLNELEEVLKKIKDPIERNEYIKYISHKLKVDEELLLQRAKKNISTKKYKPKYIPNEESNDSFKMHLNERFKHAEIELLTLYVNSFPNVSEIRSELSSINFIDEKIILIKDFLEQIEDTNTTKEEVLNKLMLEFNEFKHIMSLISELSIKIENANEDKALYNKNKNQILNEAKEWIQWWNTNMQQLKGLTATLKECKNDEEGNQILSQMMEVVKKNKENKA